MLRKFSAELIGTFFLTLTICLAPNPIAIGAMLMAMVYCAGHISGGHFNPAVTLAVWLRGKLAARLVPVYMLAQTAGAALAALLFYYLTAGADMAGHLFVYKSSEKYSDALWKAGLAESLFAFVLCWVVLTLATSSKLRGNFAYGVAIGFTLMACIFGSEGVSGGVLNPAIALGTTFFNSITLHAMPNKAELIVLAIYAVAPLLGGAAAALVFAGLNPDETY